MAAHSYSRELLSKLDGEDNELGNPRAQEKERDNPKLYLHNKYFPCLPNQSRVDGMESDLVPQRERDELVNLTSFDLISDLCGPYQRTMHLVLGALNPRQHLTSEV